MKTKLTLALAAILTSTAFAAFQAPLPEFKNATQLAAWRAEKAAETANQGYATEQSAFYTGKPYVESSGGYAFKYRSYNPELARWTSEDPSGFPDGANQSSYAPIPTCEYDYEGLRAHDAFAAQTHSITLSVYVYDDTSSFSDYSMSAWKSAVESAWKFNGVDRSNQQSMTMNVSISFTLQSGGSFNSNWSSAYDNAVTFNTTTNWISQVSNDNYGVWRSNIDDKTVVHEVGHFLTADDHYTVTYPNGIRTTKAKADWDRSIMGAMSSSAVKKDANEVLEGLNVTTHLFE